MSDRMKARASDADARVESEVIPNLQQQLEDRVFQTPEWETFFWSGEYKDDEENYTFRSNVPGDDMKLQRLLLQRNMATQSNQPVAVPAVPLPAVPIPAVPVPAPPTDDDGCQDGKPVTICTESTIGSVGEQSASDLEKYDTNAEKASDCAAL